MAAARLLACFAAAAPPCAALLHRPEQGALAHGAVSRQKLSNLNDVQYYGDISVGGQSLAGILDTGSFELVVFSKNCASCDVAGKYNESRSATYEKGDAELQHAYGSGECIASDGFDTVEITGLSAKRQPLWVASECNMPILRMAGFNAIVGIGPPGEPILSATQVLKELQAQKDAYAASSMDVPPDLSKALQSAKAQLDAAQGKAAMLENFGVTTFSECLGKQPGSPGWLIWNDATRKDASGVQRVPVAGKITWGVAATNMGFAARTKSSSRVVACKDGCGAIVDTGTSLFAVPTEIYELIFRAVNEVLQGLPESFTDCSDLSHFPDLEMEVGGQKVSFPPSSYIGRYVGQMNRAAQQFIRRRNLAFGSCQLLLMDLGMARVTPLGPMIILGMPFFREYYTTFDLGSAGPEGRSLFISRAGETCDPPAAGVVSDYAERGAHAYQPREVDVSNVRAPEGLERLRGQI